MTTFSRSGGSGPGPRLVLLHGLGGTADLWEGVIEVVGDGWPGPWTAVDLPGHGRSSPAAAYSLGAHAAAVADVLAASPGPVVVLGHSMGGAVGLALASGWFDVDVVAAVGVGVKVRWSDDELAGMTEVRRKGVRWLASEEEVAQRFVLVNGLRGVLDPAAASVRAGIVAGPDGRWRLAHDPRSIPDTAPPIAGLLAAAAADSCPVALAAGEGDAMAPATDAASFGVEAVTLAGLGHNAHVESPATVLELARRYLPAT
jgi:pimeloyl-ACP methyl ester carboxylesterase